MKTRASFFIILLSFLFLIFLDIPESNGQPFYEWEEKTPLTDSVSDNTNPYLRLIYTQSLGEMMVMTWEKSTDASSTAIYFQDIISGGEPQIVVSDPGVHYTHPYIMEIGSMDTLFYLFYESDQAGNSDIFFMKYSEDGQFTGPFPFANSAGDEKELKDMYESGFYKSSEGRYVINRLVWTDDGRLMGCDVEASGSQINFNEPVLLDSGNCSDPVISVFGPVFYIREDEAGRFIYYVTIEYPSGNWGEPVLFFDGGNCYNLEQDKVAAIFLAWSADSNAVFRNYIASNYPPYDGYALGPEQDTPFDPGICSIVIGVEPGEKFYDLFYMAFPFQDNANDEIYLNDGWSTYPEFYNFSQSGTENRNPDFYYGESYYWSCFYVYLVWEEFRNGHWQIFTAKTIMCVGGVDENSEKGSFIKTYPNPFRDEVTVSYTLSAEDYIKVDVIDLYGRKIRELYKGKQLAGGQEVDWNGKDEGGNTVSEGIYFIHLSSGKRFACSRLIKIN
jgi:hypothetical protein